MAVNEGTLPVGTTGDLLDTTIVTQDSALVAHREAVFLADPEIAAARAAVRNATPVANDYGLVVRPRITEDFWQQVAEGNVAKHSHVHKFGRHLSVGTGFVAVSVGGVYQMPQVSGAAALRVKIGDTNDTALGSGAREITLEGLDETGAMVTEAIPTAGTSAGAASTATFMRLFRAYVSKSGTYATTAGGSHAADIVIETTGGTAWATIDESDLALGQTEIGLYTVPLGSTAYVTNMSTSVDSAKLTEFRFFQRRNILETVAPFSALRIIREMEGSDEFVPVIPLGPYPALTDIGFLAKAASGTPEADVDFEILLVAD